MYSASWLASLPQAQREAILNQLTDDEIQTLSYQWRGFWARPEQLAPPGDWSFWLNLAGRGVGKTRTGVEWVNEEVEAGARRITIAGRTAADVRDVLVQGESGFLNVGDPRKRPIYKPSQRALIWANGARAVLLSADEPDTFRGHQHERALADEFAAWQYAEAWDQLAMGLRLGPHPRACITTTPRPTKSVKELMNNPATVVTRGKTKDNAANLPAAFLSQILRKYEGTRLGRQELDGEVLGDAPGALWTYSQMDKIRTRDVAGLVRIIIAIDPATTTGEDSDETGIIAAGLDEAGYGYVLDDVSGKYSPNEWARKAIALATHHEADAIVIETNQGGDMVENTLRTVAPNIRIIRVHAKRGKRLRAEPVAALYEQNKVRHVFGLTTLEDQMCTWEPSSNDSPDRMDAAVYALTELMLGEQHVERLLPQGYVA